mgnify:CR=1 FL=1
MSLRRPTVACLLFKLLISPLCGVAQTPDCGMPVISFIYKPFMRYRSDARLRHALYYYPFEVSLQTPDRCILFLFSDCIGMFYMNNLLACITNSISSLTSDYGKFPSIIIICYIIPVFLMFASTFKSTHWLVPGYCLGQISCMERSDRDDSPGT